MEAFAGAPFFLGDNFKRLHQFYSSLLGSSLPALVFFREKLEGYWVGKKNINRMELYNLGVLIYFDHHENAA
ncbi:MAG: hypothetical protein GX770_06635 [Firmicutes bacterium]|nr:hypothetical protein [Bacillota bacterium]